MRYGTGVILVLTAGVLWSFQALMIRQIEATGSWTVLFWRSLAMIPALILFLSWSTRGRTLRAMRQTGMAGLLGGLSLVAAMAGAITAFQTTTVANACFLLAASPFLTALLGRAVLGEAISPRSWIAIGIALLGIFVMVQDGLGAGTWFGNIAALSSALGWAGFAVALRWRRLGDSLPASVLGAILSVAVGAAMSWGAGDSLAVPITDILWCAAMGVVTLTGGMVLYTLGSHVVPAGEMVLLSNTEMLLAPVWVWLVMGETASPATLLGGGIVSLAILFNAWSGIRRPALA